MFNWSLFQPRTRKNALSPYYLDFGMLEKKLEDPFATPMCLPLIFLKSITRDFSEEQELGRGAFGVVYKGTLQNGKAIAVKKLSRPLEEDQFQNEVTYLIGVKHENVVQLLGYCAETQRLLVQENPPIWAENRVWLICFEYLNNKSLDEYISDESCGLEWPKRFEIIRGICYGLEYLHDKCNIVHLDLKPQNILMDDNMEPKIADFGTSRLFGQQEFQTTTENRKGTYGYMAPEYLNDGLITTKADIFSLGVIIMELLIGSRDYPDSSETPFGHFIENVVEKWSNSRLAETWTDITSAIYIQQINACAVMGLRCVDSDPTKRPAAWDIIEMLNATESENRYHGRTPMVLACCRTRTKSFKRRRLRHLHHPFKPDSVLPYKAGNVRDYYRIGKKLGQGQCGSGTTYQCVRKADGAEYACKSIPKGKLLYWEDYEGVYREIQVMHHLSDHPSAVRIHGAYEDKLFVHIVMELCAGGDLLDRIVSKQGPYSERAAAQLIRKVVGVVDGCHSLGVVHGILNPENLWFASSAEDAALKATDFEFSEFYMPGDKFSRISGSTYYVAPEVLQKCYGPEADIWSAGVILYILLSGIPPFWAETEEGTDSEILQGEVDFESDPWPSISDSAKDLIRNMLTRDPKKRFSAHAVLCHPWMIDDAVAPDKPTDSAVLSRLKHFSAMNMFTKMVLKVIAESMSEEEIGGLKKLFEMFDTEYNETITFDELKEGLKRLNSALSDDEIQTLMNAADIDSDGTIDCAEFVAATLHMNKLEREENLLSAFSFFDKDANGYITTDELSQACRELSVDVVHLDDTIKDIDQNNDGRISYNEFAAMMRKDNAGKP